MQEKYIAMWSVPRSLGTALLQSWSNRPDAVVFDELLSFPYLFIKEEDLGFTWAEVNPDKMQYEAWRNVIHQLRNPMFTPEEKCQQAIDMLTAPLPENKSICYQKHQAYHLLEKEMGLDWILPLQNCFLIRQPKDMLLSFNKIVPDFTFEDTGWPALKRVFDYLHQKTGSTPLVIDAYDLLHDPEGVLSSLCQALGVEFNEAMLNWPPTESELNEKLSPWYSSVANSTHFQPYKPKNEPLPPHLVDICKLCHEIYQELYEFRLL